MGGRGKPQFTSWIETGKGVAFQKIFRVLSTENKVDVAKMTNAHYTWGFSNHVI